MDDVSKLLSRPQLYYDIDGVGELGMGLMSLGYSLLGWMMLHSPETAVWHKMYTLFIFVGVISFIIHNGSKAIKSRITYRRTGYVEYPARKHWATMAQAACVAALTSAGLFIAARRHFALTTLAFLFFLLIAVLYIRMIRLYRWKWAVFAAMVVSTVLIAFLPADLLENLAGHSSLGSALTARTLGASWLTWTAFGVLFLVSGAISFWLYLRHTQPVAQESE
jgi:hypothetical protein